MKSTSKNTMFTGHNKKQTSAVQVDAVTAYVSVTFNQSLCLRIFTFLSPSLM